MQIFKSLFRSGSLIKTTFILCYLLSLVAEVLNLDSVTSLVNAAFAFTAVFVTYKGNLINRPIITELVIILIMLLIYNITGHSQLYVGWNGANERGVFLETFLLFIYLIIPCYLSKTSRLNDKDIEFLFYITFIYAIVMYFKNLFIVSTLIGSTLGVGETTNNFGYMFVCLSPFLFLLENKKKQISLLLTAFIIVFLSAKRGAILLEIIFLFFYLYNTYLKGRISLGKILMFVILIGIVSLVCYNIMLSNEYIYNKFIMTTEGYSSGRDTITEDILRYVFGPNRSSFSLFFGSGIGTSVNVAGKWAHNDWLEFLSMSGVLGILVYLKFYLAMWNIKNKVSFSKYFLVFVSTAMLLFVMSFFSMAILISTSTSYFLMVLMGYSYGKLTYKV